MVDEPRGHPPAKNWRFGLVVGLSIGLGLAISREVETAFEPSLGHWGALLVGVVAAGLGGGLAALLVSWLLGRRGSGRGG